MPSLRENRKHQHYINVRRSGKCVEVENKLHGSLSALLKNGGFEFLEISSGEGNNVSAISSGKEGCFPLNQKFRNFLNEDKCYRNLHEKFPEIEKCLNFRNWNHSSFNRNFRKFRKENKIEWKFLVIKSRKLGIPREPVLFSVFSRGYSCIFSRYER